jgi:RNA polymerase primary sigma factor
MRKKSGEMALEVYLREIWRFPLLSASEEERFARRYREGDQVGRQVLITRNLRLVVTIAKRYSDMGLGLLELIAEGNLGLMHAVDRFDPDRGCRFSTYATYWIKHAICRALTDKNQIVRIPSYMRKILSKAKETSRQLAQAGIEPTQERVLSRLDVSDKSRPLVAEALRTSRSIEGVRSLSTYTEQKDVLEDTRSEDHETVASDRMDFQRLNEVISELPARKVRILEMRYGLGNYEEPMTLREIGERVNLTKERVRQIEKETLQRLRMMMMPESAVA